MTFDFYIRHYIIETDEYVQSPVSKETAENAIKVGVEVYTEAHPTMIVKSRFRSEWNLPPEQWSI